MGQDVSDWVMKGYLDWVSPMIYSDNVNNGMDSFQGMLRGCVKWYSAGPHGKVPLIPFIMADGHGWGGYVSPTISTIEVDAIRQYGGDGYILWQFIPTSGDTSYPQPYWDAYAANCTNGLFNVFGVTNVLATPSNETAVISWTTSSAATTVVNYASTLFFNETWKADTLPSWSPYNSQSFNYWYPYNNVTTQSSSQVNMTLVTSHSVTLSALTPLTLYYFRIQSWDSYGNATSGIFTFFTSETSQVTVTILTPTNTTYTTSTVPVQLSASGGTIDTILWNCTFTNGTVAYANTVYTTPTNMTLGNGSYIFNAWANNTDGEWDEATVTFTVAISSSSVTLIITSPSNTTYSSSTIPVLMFASGGTIDRIWWNIQFENSSWLYPDNQTYTVATSVTINENLTATFHGYANNTDGNSDDGSVIFTVYLVPNTIGYQLGQAAIGVAGFMGIVMLLGMVYVVAEGKDVKYAVMLTVGEVLLLVTMLVLSQLAILG